MNLRNNLFKLLFEFTLKLRGESFYDILALYEKNQYLPKDRLTSIQLEKLNSIISWAKSNTIYYSDKVPSKVTSLEELASIPLLDKDILRANQNQLISKFGHLQRSKTSGGSTGAPVSIIKNSKGIAQEMAASWRGYHWAGIKVGDRQARFWGIPRNLKERARSKLIDIICHRIRITAFGYNDKSFDRSIIKLERFNPDYLYGYTSIIEELANYIEKTKRKPKLNICSVITTSEALSRPTRERIESVFGCRVFDEYGCGEVGTIAHECEHGRLHLNMENSIIEVIDTNGNPVLPGQAGEIVVTDLTNYSMPLIRYRIKDYGVIRPTPCECGRTLDVLDSVFGREYDALINSQGEKFHGEFFLYIAEDAKKLGHIIQGIQFIQSSHNTITIRVAPSKPSKSLESFMTNRIQDQFDHSFYINYEWVNEISREPSGKLRVVKYESKS